MKLLPNFTCCFNLAFSSSDLQHVNKTWAEELGAQARYQPELIRTQVGSLLSSTSHKPLERSVPI